MTPRRVKGSISGNSMSPRRAGGSISGDSMSPRRVRGSVQSGISAKSGRSIGSVQSRRGSPSHS